MLAVYQTFFLSTGTSVQTMDKTFISLGLHSSGEGRKTVNTLESVKEINRLGGEG